MEIETLRPIMEQIHQTISNFISSKDAVPDSIGIYIECIGASAIYVKSKAAIGYRFRINARWLMTDGMVYRIRRMPVAYQIDDGGDVETNLNHNLHLSFEDALQYGYKEPTP